MMVSRRAPDGTPVWVWGVVGLCVMCAAGAAYVGWQARYGEEEAGRPDTKGKLIPSANAASAATAAPKTKPAP